MYVVLFLLAMACVPCALSAQAPAALEVSGGYRCSGSAHRSGFSGRLDRRSGGQGQRLALRSRRPQRKPHDHSRRSSQSALQRTGAHVRRPGLARIGPSSNSVRFSSGVIARKRIGPGNDDIEHAHPHPRGRRRHDYPVRGVRVRGKVDVRWSRGGRRRLGASFEAWPASRIDCLIAFAESRRKVNEENHRRCPSSCSRFPMAGDTVSQAGAPPNIAFDIPKADIDCVLKNAPPPARPPASRRRHGQVQPRRRHHPSGPDQRQTGRSNPDDLPRLHGRDCTSSRRDRAS